jgi:methyl-accepting chemotaxis protein
LNVALGRVFFCQDGLGKEMSAEPVASNITGVREATEQTGAAAGDVLESAGQLSRQSELLRGEVGKFLSGLRAA